MAISAPIGTYFAQTLREIYPDLMPDTPFIDELGGDMFFVETQAELDWLLADEQFDMFVKEDIGDIHFSWLWVCQNNAGGPTYIIPQGLDMRLLKESYDEYGDLEGIHGDKP